MCWAISIALIWAAQSLVAYAGACAWWDLMSEIRWRNISDRRDTRSLQVWCAFLSLLPFSVISAAICSEFFRYGFRFNVRPSTMFGGPRR